MCSGRMNIKKKKHIIEWWMFGGVSGDNFFAGANLDTLNRYVSIDLQYASYTSDGVSPIEATDFSLTFTQNGGTATNVVIASVTNSTGGALVGGETEIRVYITTTGSASGVELIEITPSAQGSIVSGGGDIIISGSDTTGQITMNLSYVSEYVAVLGSLLDDGLNVPSEAQRLVDNDKVTELVTSGAWAEFDFLYPLFNNIYEEVALRDWKNPTTRNATKSGTVLKTVYAGYRSNGTSYIDLTYIPLTDGVK